MRTLVLIIALSFISWQGFGQELSKAEKENIAKNIKHLPKRYDIYFWP